MITDNKFLKQNSFGMAANKIRLGIGFLAAKSYKFEYVVSNEPFQETF